MIRKTPQYSKQFFVKGIYEYYHCKQDGYTDEGWGNAYRSLQTLVSWFLKNGFKKDGVYVPSILDIQKNLLSMGDKPSKIVDSKDLIGNSEVKLILNEILGIASKIISVSSFEELEKKGKDLIPHFEENGTPVMISGEVFCYIILGLEYNRTNGKSLFLVLDPQYSGKDDIKTILSKGGCQWKEGSFWKNENVINLLIPHIPI